MSGDSGKELWIIAAKRRVLQGFAETFCFLHTDCMSNITELEDRLDLLKDRLKSHSLYVINDLLPRIEHVETAVKELLISDDRFAALENAVADIALVVYKQQARFPTDRRQRQRRQYRRAK